MNKFTASAVALAVTFASQAAYAHSHWKESFAKADTNGDGKLSQAEFDAAGNLKFNAIDTNNDGFITVEEQEAFHAEKHGSKETSADEHPSTTEKLKPENTPPSAAKE